MTKRDFERIKKRWGNFELKVRALTAAYLKNLQHLRADLQKDIDALTFEIALHKPIGKLAEENGHPVETVHENALDYNFMNAVRKSNQVADEICSRVLSQAGDSST